MSIYETPFLIPSQPEVLQGSRLTGRYGSTEAPQDDIGQTLEAVEQYAPTVATLIAGLSVEEQEAVLKEKIRYLETQVNTPIIGLYAKAKIPEYKARLVILAKNAETERLERVLKTSAYIFGLLAVGGLAFFAYSAGYKQLRSSE
jgi:hypothetical protein